MNPLIHHWGRRLSLLLVAICLSAFAYVTWDLAASHLAAGRHMLAVAQSETRHNAQQLGRELQQVKHLCEQLAGEFAGSPPPAAVIEARLDEILQNHPRIYGAAICYLPGRHPEHGPLYAPYVIRQDDTRKLVYIDESYDYTATGSTWFRQPLERGPGWVPVYWGEAGQSMMATYAAPVADRQGNPQAVLVIDLALNEIWKLVGNLDFGSTSYGFLIDSDGKLIAHPLKELVLGKRHIDQLFNGGDDTTSKAVARALESRQPAVLQQINTVTQQPSLTVLAPIPEAGWFMGATFVKQELELTHHDALRLWLRFVAATVFLIISLALLYLGSDRAPLARRLHLAAIVCGVTLGVGLTALWSLQHMMGVDSPYHDHILDSQAGVKRLQTELAQYSRDSHLPPPRFIPTGVLVRALKMTGLNEVQATGILWQSYPPDTPVRMQQFWFPDALSTELQEIYRMRQDGREVVGWAFDAKLRQTFDNRAYPFDDIAVRLRIRPRQTLGRFVYVPDLAAYDVVIPSARPFVAGNISVPGWHVVQTYFRPQEHGYGMNYGLHGSLIDPVVRDLVLVTTLKRNLLDNLISVIIPVLVLILLAYGGILMTTGDPEKLRIYDFKPMRMLLVGTSFCLFLILATINLRSRVASDAIIYIEQLYFLLYFMAFGNVFLAMKIANRSNRLLAYEDGRLVKAFYFPVVLAAVFLITLIAFHR